jgi:hypothetical protein
MTNNALFFPAALLACVAVAACGQAKTPDAPDASDTTSTPASPAGFMVMEMSGGAHLSWQDTFLNETGFEAQRKVGTAEFAKLVDLPVNTSEYHDGAAPKGTPLTYRVRAIGAAGPGAWSAEASITLEQSPSSSIDAPMALKTMKMSGGLHVSWMNMANDATGVELQHKTMSTEYSTVATLAASKSSYMDMSVQAGATYTYRVRALRGSDFSAWSDEASGTP